MKSLMKVIRQNTGALLVLVAVVSIGAGFLGINSLTKNSKAVANDCQGLCVSISPEGMQPNELAVKTGEFVQFNSADGKTHNLAFGGGTSSSVHEGNETDGNGHDASHDHDSSYSSGDFGADEAWRVQFKNAGTFRFHDHYNPDLEILIVVYDPTTKTDQL